jgi:hypothetical protein
VKQTAEENINLANLRIYPYVIGSESAQKLADLLEVLQVKPDGNYTPKYSQKVLNWGSSTVPNWATKAQQRGVTILNKPSAVNIAANKLSTFNALSAAGISIPKYTTDRTTAMTWLSTGSTVVERHQLRGNSGAGIRIVNLHDPEMPNDLQSAPLYTKFIPKSAEFRVHVFRGEVIDYIEKKRLPTERRPANFNEYISSTHCGWVFSRTGIRDMPEVRLIAIKAVLGLDFGAVDIVYENGLPYVLEINSAPGLNGTTLVKYANALRKFMGQPDLSSAVTQPLMDRITPPPVIAAHVAQVDNTLADLVTFQLDRNTARKLKTVLLSLNL